MRSFSHKILVPLVAVANPSKKLPKLNISKIDPNEGLHNTTLQSWGQFHNSEDSSKFTLQSLLGVLKCKLMQTSCEGRVIELETLSRLDHCHCSAN